MYRAEGRHVYQAEKHIVTCFIGHQGQSATAIAERIAALLNADLGQFCINLAASCDTHAKRGDVEQAPSPMSGAVPPVEAGDAQTLSPKGGQTNA